MGEKELDMNDLIISFEEYSTDFIKETCLYYANYLKEYQKEKLDLQQENDYLIASDIEKIEMIKQLKERIEYLQRSISRKEETIINLQNELVETPKETELENRIDKAIDKLICWGEVLDARFQQDMLDILEGGKNE